jgi:outer membrane protein OmpA-like peptidoglycan-associated protein
MMHRLLLLATVIALLISAAHASLPSSPPYRMFNFNSGQSDWRPGAEEKIRGYLGPLLEFAKSVDGDVIVRAWADPIEPDPLLLSVNRALYVKSVLVSLGVQPDHIEIAAHGVEPAARPNDPINARVELKILNWR